MKSKLQALIRLIENYNSGSVSTDELEKAAKKIISDERYDDLPKDVKEAIQHLNTKELDELAPHSKLYTKSLYWKIANYSATLSKGNKYIVAIKDEKSGEYKPHDYCTVNDLQEGLMSWGLMYDEALSGYYQVWEYPSGNIYSIKPDREIDVETAYDLRGAGFNGPEWKAVTTKIGQDKEKVDAIIQEINSKRTIKSRWPWRKDNSNSSK